MLLIDASIACKWYLDEADSEQARAIVGGGDDLVAPDIILPEVANALWRCNRRGEITAENAAGALKGLEMVFHSLIPTAPITVAAFELAASLRHPVYDCVYLIAARNLGIPMVTADSRLCAVVRGTAWQGVVAPLDVASRR
ncbi:putative nucleic acid-binding protein [Stella humosa]|uniref:Ribonuclease VapC n=1 Tax=Stella humosa TaxID=94 RepID=A0A3N1KNC9_9PROT|nr:type II toxin-antitoxin system VapC family toxin [Stella humosa]ROP80857.1 putative nucleic acid-binding protein [Stella humosa]BBK33350.1 hypothetical protein STHU_39840 [Stella humosa]